MKGQVTLTGGAGLTVKVALHVLGTSQELVTVKVTVLLPPQKLGAPLLSLLMVALHPPLKLTVFSQVANLVSICAWV